MDFVFFTDPLTSVYGAVRPALTVSKELARRGHDVTILTPYSMLSDFHKVRIAEIKEKIQRSGKTVLTKIPLLREWMKALILPYVHEREKSESLVINTSSSLITEADAYYGQGQITKAIDDMSQSRDFPLRYKVIYKFIRGMLVNLEKRLMMQFRENSALFITNSNFTKSLYESWGIKVDHVIYPPLDLEVFRPTTQKPSRDYVLAYLGIRGKETNLKVIKELARQGVKIKAFGKSSKEYEKELSSQNIEILGYVDDNTLVDLYTNALFTLFTFTDEPFGYIPVESMACGTPVITYDKQGPKNTVSHNRTGWLVSNDEELVREAIRIWKQGYDESSIKNKCLANAQEYDVKKIADEWLNCLNQLRCGVKS
ncbi:glycosyltransferase family 4 protein [Sulfolobus acidocaldarius]|uniref:glycosyltransferase family 4 protein n=1 Tax=Sulfolobus acidocaldarius TaxID=2285 RepID=UPI000785E5A8|nr:glycosyltransferase [Sulfolobus acidocaldarius]